MLHGGGALIKRLMNVDEAKEIFQGYSKWNEVFVWIKNRTMPITKM